MESWCHKVTRYYALRKRVKVRPPIYRKVYLISPPSLIDLSSWPESVAEHYFMFMIMQIL